MKKDTRAFTYVCGLLLAVLLIAALPVAGEEALYDDVLRLHILANSDSEQDQALKLALRDHVLAVYGDTLASYTSKEEATAEIAALQATIREDAEAWIREQGFEYSVQVTLTHESYPRRDYEQVSLPAGTYCSLRIIIGEGAGQNWWCVLFPPMCVGTAVGEAADDDGSIPAGISSQQYKLISGGGRYRVKFKVLEFVEGLFS